MRRVLVDGLVVVAHDLGLREGLVLPVHALILELLLVRSLVVGPIEHHTGLAGVDGAVGHVHGGQVAGFLQLLEEVKTRLQVIDVAACELVDHQVAVEGGTGFGGLAVQGHRAGELGIEQIVQRVDLTVLIGIPAHGHDAGVVGVVGAVGILGGVRNLVPGLHLVRSEAIGGSGGDGLADIEHVGGGVGALVGLGGVKLFLGGSVRVELGDLDLRVLLLKALDDLAVVGPVVRQRDDVQRTLFLGGLFEVFHSTEVGEGSGLGGLPVHGDGLAGTFAGAIGGGAAGAAGGHGERKHGGKGAGRDLTQVIHNVPFLNIIQTEKSGGTGLVARHARSP